MKFDLTNSDIERFISHCKQDDSGCVLWTKARLKQGYGLFKVKGKMLRAHRVSYFLNKGDIPDGMDIRHKCDNPPCVNPDHLEYGTTKQNCMDMVERKRSLIGSKNPDSKLNEQQVRWIKIWLRKGYSLNKLAALYSVSKKTILRIKQNTHWKHVH